MTEQTWMTLITGFFGFLMASLQLVAAIYLAKVKGDTGESLKQGEKAAIVNDQIHKAVNSNHKALDDKLVAALALLDQANKEILELSIQKAAAAGIPLPSPENPLPVAIVAIPEEAAKPEKKKS